MWVIDSFLAKRVDVAPLDSYVPRTVRDSISLLSFPAYCILSLVEWPVHMDLLFPMDPCIACTVYLRLTDSYT